MIRSLPSFALLTLLVACTFDGTGLSASAGASEGSSTTTDGETTTGSSATSEATTTTASASATGTTASTTSTSEPTTSTTAPTTTTTTTGPGSCGDGMIDPGEECDNGEMNGESASCKGDCTNNVCGDGAVGPGESCDDGNLVGGDGCSASCVSELCGDGNVDMGEECDDMNADNTDECTDACTKAVCGDGYVQKAAGDECDDGVDNGNSKACTAICTINTCGDGFVHEGVEACDDGNLEPTDACTDACNVATCGDGIIHADVEECDDGNDSDNDPCTNACKKAACGDGFIQGAEECDDGNQVDDDACSNACLSTGKRVFVTEQTWSGNLGGFAGANAKCQAAADAEGLGGAWKAWIATGAMGEAPADHFTKSTTPYRRLDGMQVAANWTDLTDGTIAVAINITEKKVAAPGATEVWTNVKADGTRLDAAKHCTNFTSSAGGQDSRIGRRTATDQKWTDEVDNMCNASRHLYCFEQ